MKKVFAFCLVLVYGVTSFGMTLHMHYCCGKLDKVSLSSNETTSCKSTTELHGKRCCDSKKFELKIKTEQESAFKQITTFSFQSVGLLAFHSSKLFLLNKRLVTQVSIWPPPTLSAIPLFIKYSVYRI